MANDALVAEMLDLIVNDSENLERTMNLLTDDAVWVLEPGVRVERWRHLRARQRCSRLWPAVALPCRASARAGPDARRNVPLLD
jgi:hypothetical protein